MQNSIAAARQEFIKEITKTINNSRLPFYVTIPILGDLLASMQSGAQENFEIYMKEYANSIIQHETEEQNHGD